MNLLHLMILLAVLGLATVPALTALERLAHDRAAAERERPEWVTIREHFSGGGMNNFRGNGMPRN